MSDTLTLVAVISLFIIFLGRGIVLRIKIRQLEDRLEKLCDRILARLP